MRTTLAALAAGVLFGLGIAVSGMINPAKVLNFFDVLGTWDPSLAFVMAGGLITAFVGYRLVFGRMRAPVFAPSFPAPARGGIDAQLIGGAAIFGIGWGIAGFCPGAALPALALGYGQTPIFVLAVIVGIAMARSLRAMRPNAARA